MEFRSKAEENVYNAMKSGNYSIASIQMLDNINNLILSDNTKSHLEYTNELLFEYLYELDQLKDEHPGLKEYLNALKAGDVIDNQSLEKENSFLIGLYMQTLEETAQDKMLYYAKNNIEITKEILKDLAVLLLRGTSTKKEDIIRTSNDKYVGKIVNGEFKVSYFPIDYHDVDIALTGLAQFYNTRLNDETYNNLFVQPFVIHGLYGALQVFGDGNTRMGRLNQHLLLWQLINERTKFNFDAPPLYVTRNYYPYRDEYRKLISSLVTIGNNEAWNEWILFNLKRLEDQIFQNNENIFELKRSL